MLGDKLNLQMPIFWKQARDFDSTPIKAVQWDVRDSNLQPLRQMNAMVVLRSSPRANHD